MPSPLAGYTRIMVNRVQYRLPAVQFMGKDATVKKSGVVLHFTAGSTVEGAYQSWLADSARVGTAYIVGKDGSVYETFEPGAWAYHLGAKDALQEKRTIGIELVNEGPLQVNGDNLVWWPGEFSAKYCVIGQREKYVHVPEGWRGFHYFASFSQEQIQATAALVGTLLDQFSIPRAFLPEGKRLEYCPVEARKLSGITTHANWRKDKFDIGPAFDWKSIGG